MASTRPPRPGPTRQLRPRRSRPETFVIPYRTSQVCRCLVQIFSKSVTAAAVAVTGEPDEFEKIALKVIPSVGSTVATRVGSRLSRG